MLLSVVSVLFVVFVFIQHAHWFNEKSFSDSFSTKKRKFAFAKIQFVMNQNYADAKMHSNISRAQNKLKFNEQWMNKIQFYTT